MSHHTHTLLPYSQFSLLHFFSLCSHWVPFLFSFPQRPSLCIENHPLPPSSSFSQNHNVRKVQETFSYDEMKSKSTTHKTELCCSSNRAGENERDDDVVYIEYLNISPSKILDCASAETREWVYVVSVFIFSMEILLAEVMEPPSLFYACSQKRANFPFILTSRKKYIENWGHQTGNHTHTHTLAHSFCAYIHFYFAHL